MRLSTCLYIEAAISQACPQYINKLQQHPHQSTKQQPKITHAIVLLFGNDLPYNINTSKSKQNGAHFSTILKTRILSRQNTNIFNQNHFSYLLMTFYALKMSANLIKHEKHKTDLQWLCAKANDIWVHLDKVSMPILHISVLQQIFIFFCSLHHDASPAFTKLIRSLEQTHQTTSQLKIHSFLAFPSLHRQIRLMLDIDLLQPRCLLPNIISSPRKYPLTSQKNTINPFKATLSTLVSLQAKRRIKKFSGFSSASFITIFPYF